MLIGAPKEIKNHEYRVGLTPASVQELVAQGHQVIVENNAGAGIDFSNEEYIAAGASIIDTAKEIFDRADMIVKVKEPQPEECQMLREGQLLFTYLHLAPDPEQTELLVQSGATCVAYETVTDSIRGGLPLLAPMSEVAGRMAALLADPDLLNGLNVHKGMVVYEAVARALGYDYVDPREALEK